MRYTHTAAWVAPAILIGYVALARLLMPLLEYNPPASVEILLSIFIAPLFYIFRPLYPLLKPLGLLEGEWWTLPSAAGMALCTAVYAVLLYAAGLIILQILNGTKRP